MADPTIYEATHKARMDAHSSLCFGRIVAVFPDSRTCSVKTFFSTNPTTNNQHIENCQWLNMDCNPAGDESTSIPRAGSIGMVLFIQGEPFVFGYFKALNSQGEAITGDEVAQLTEGDKIFSTGGGNYIKIGANGSIIIHSKETLRTLYFPTKSLLQHLCRTFEHRADGGKIDWTSDKSGATLYQGLFRNGTAATAFVLEQNGAADDGKMRRVAIGPGPGGFGNIYVYEQTIDIDGTCTTEVGPPGAPIFKDVVNPDGSFSRSNGGGNAYSQTVSATGELEVDLGPTVSISAKPDGTVSVTTPTALISVSASGDVSITTEGKADLQFGGEVDVTAAGDIKLVALGSCVLSAAGGLKLDGTGAEGAAALFGLLTFPNVIDPLTGAPLGPGTTTITASFP